MICIRRAAQYVLTLGFEFAVWDRFSQAERPASGRSERRLMT